MLTYKDFTIHHFDHVLSTQQSAKDFLTRGSANWTVIQADLQSHGRGRGERFWFSHSNSLLFSLIYCPSFDFELFSSVNMMVTKSIIECFPEQQLAVKWPNDLMLLNTDCNKMTAQNSLHGPYYKVGGILTEVVSYRGRNYLIIGIGLNLKEAPNGFPPNLKEIATGILKEQTKSLKMTAFEKQQILYKLLESLKENLEQIGNVSKMQNCLNLLKSRSMIIGRKVEIDGVIGHAVDLDMSGALVVEKSSKRELVWAGDVIWVKDS